MTIATLSIALSTFAIVANAIIWRSQRRMSRALDAWEQELDRLEQAER